MLSSVSAFCIAHTLTTEHPIHLAPFAVWTAFPSSDYYGASVALSLAAGRRSRVSCLNDVQDGLGALFVPLRPSHCGPTPPECVAPIRFFYRSSGECRMSPIVSGAFHLHLGHWGSGSLAFTMPSGPRPAC